MKHGNCRRQHGFLLLPVVLVLTLVALIAYAATREREVDMPILEAGLQLSAARYLSEAAVGEAAWRADRAGCAGYQDISGNAMGSGVYDASFSVDAGSPVTIAGVGRVAGAEAELRREVAVFDYQNVTTVKQQPGPDADDTYVSGDDPGTNYVWSDVLSVEGGDGDVALLRFDLDDVPAGAHIVSAELDLYLSNRSGSNLIPTSVHRLTSDWDPYLATWNMADGAPWGSAGGDYDPTPADTIDVNWKFRWYTWDVTTLVADWVSGAHPNHGVALVASGSSNLRFASSKWWSDLEFPRLSVSYTCECGVVCAALVAGPTAIVLSTDGPASIAGVSLLRGDAVEYDTLADSAAPVFVGGDEFTSAENVNALHVMDDGRIALSTDNDAVLGGEAIGDDDVVAYDPDTASVTFLLDGARFTAGSEDVDAVHVLDNGHLVLSTDAAATIGGVTFDDGDLVQYDGAADAAVVLLRESIAFESGNEDIDAVHILADGRLVLSADTDYVMAGVAAADEDLVLYDPLRNAAELVFDGGLAFAADEELNAVHDSRWHLDPALWLEPEADTYIDSSSPAGNFGSATGVFAGAQRQALLRFDLSVVPAGATITAATLHVSLATDLGSSVDLGVHEVTDAWDESTVTWTSFDAEYEPAPLDTTSLIPSVSRWVTWNVPSGLVHEWLDGVTDNHGLLINLAAPGGVTVEARSTDFWSTLLRPRLILEYTTP